MKQHRTKIQVPGDQQKYPLVKKKIRDKLGQTGKPKLYEEGTIQWDIVYYI
jgi:hypothetical protein